MRYLCNLNFGIKRSAAISLTPATGETKIEAVTRVKKGSHAKLRNKQASDPSSRQAGGQASRQAAMERPPGEWMRPDPAAQVVRSGGNALQIIGSTGSTWSTADERRAKGWPEAVEPHNIFALGPLQPASWEARIEALPRSHGEQAGLYAYGDASSWVKFVLEGAGDGKVMLVFAEQRDGVPFLRGKVPLDDFEGGLHLRLEVHGEGQVLAFWRHSISSSVSGSDAWVQMVRGHGWLTPTEQQLASSPKPGALEAGDSRGSELAACNLPRTWRAVLLTEQWQTRTVVTFEDVAMDALASTEKRTKRKAGR